MGRNLLCSAGPVLGLGDHEWTRTRSGQLPPPAAPRPQRIRAEETQRRTASGFFRPSPDACAEAKRLWERSPPLWVAARVGRTTIQSIQMKRAAFIRAPGAYRLVRTGQSRCKRKTSSLNTSPLRIRYRAARAANSACSSKRGHAVCRIPAARKWRITVAIRLGTHDLLPVDELAFPLCLRRAPQSISGLLAAVKQT